MRCAKLFVIFFAGVLLSYPVAAQQIDFPPDVQSAEKRDLSPLEEDYSARAGAILQQFGYEFFGDLPTPDSTLLVGLASDSYRLGPGDEIVVSLRGQVNETLRTRVDREGRVLLPRLQPISAAGRSFGDFRRELKAQVERVFIDTESFVSIGAVREFYVVVAGEVRKPGMHRVTGLSTVLDALAAAGGVIKSGSLRRVQLRRGGEVRVLDLYKYLLGGVAEGDVALQAGDRIVVPTLGPTVAVTGEVLRPGIYELEQPGITADELLSLAGNTIRPRGYRYARLVVDEQSQTVLEPLDNLAARVEPGDVLRVEKISEGQDSYFSVAGNAAVPGQRSLRAAPTLRALMTTAPVTASETYMLFGAIRRWDRNTGAAGYVSFSPRRVLDGQEDFRLQSEDTVIFLGLSDVRFLSSASVQRAMSGEVAGNCAGLEAVAALIARGESVRFDAARLQAALQGMDAEEEGDCPEIFREHPDLLPYLLEHVASVQGEVQAPGLYPVRPATGLHEVLAAAGGLTLRADREKIELMRLGEPGLPTRAAVRRQFSLAEGTPIALSPGDHLRVPPVYGWQERGTVVVRGEVRRPGVYVIRRGERLSELLERAGGLTEDAYAMGAVFTRQAVREQEAESFQVLARDLELALATALSQGGSALSQGGSEGRSQDQQLVAGIQQAIKTLRSTEPLGRVVVEADPAVLQVRPELDTLLQAGDSIYVPKRPNHVMVVGQVLHPGAQQFRSGRTADQYLRMAGGLRDGADEERIFVVLPSGQARPLRVAFWNHEVAHIPPGSTIVVPQDPRPFTLLGFARDIMDILSKAAVTAASLAVLAD